MLTVAPTITGTPSVGQTLSCSNGSWVGAPTLSYAYKWLRDGSEIGGATNGTYVGQNKVDGPVPLEAGVAIRIGKTVMELR